MAIRSREAGSRSLGASPTRLRSRRLFKSDNELANAAEARDHGRATRGCARPSSRTRGSRWIIAASPSFEPGAETVLQILRLCWSSDAFLAQAIYRVKAALQRRGVPVLPRSAIGSRS